MTKVGQCRFPLCSPLSRSSDVLMWDGRLHNRAELLTRFRTVVLKEASDAVLAQASYDERGVPGLAQLIGDWGVVIRDARAGAVILASDFAGVRPLYYSKQAGRLAWSTSLEALVQELGTVEPNETYFAGFMLVGGYPSLTPYDAIFSVPPGHAVCVSAASNRIERFWAMPVFDTCRYRDERRYDEHLRVLFREAVAVRLGGAHPVLAELSGGLDSSSVVCMAHDLIRSGSVAAPRLDTISYITPESADAPFIREVESVCRTAGTHLSTERAPLFSAATPPGAMPQGCPPLQLAVAAVARERGVQTFLTGQAGDLVMGNWRDDSLQVAQHVRRGRLVRAVKEALTWSMVTGTPVAAILANAVAANASPERLRCLPRSPEMLPGTQAASSLRPSLLRRTGLTEVETVFSTDWLQAPVERRAHFRSLSMLLQLRALQTPVPLQELDYTHPFAHRPLVEFLMSVPADVVCRPSEPRRLMRRAFAALWPHALRNRRSKGLFAAAYLDAFRPFAMRLLRARRWQVVERGWVDPASLVARVERLVSGLDCNHAQLRQILLAENWLRHTSGDGSRAA